MPQVDITLFYTLIKSTFFFFIINYLIMVYLYHTITSEIKFKNSFKSLLVFFNNQKNHTDISMMLSDYYLNLNADEK